MESKKQRSISAFFNKESSKSLSSRRSPISLANMKAVLRFGNRP